MTQHTPEINIRQQTIIRTLLNAHGKSTLKDLAEITSLSPRVIRYNMDIVRSWLMCWDIEFINRPGYGVEVVSSQQMKSELLQHINSMDGCNIILSKKQRMRIILLHLLTTKEPLSASHLAEVENFSRSTLFKDICDIETWLETYNINLIRRSSKGIWIEGSEESRRFALSRLMREELGEDAWYALPRFFLENQKHYNRSISTPFSHFLSNLDLNFTRKMIRYIEENTGLKMTVISQVEIMVYLAIMIQAALQGQQIDDPLDEALSDSIENSASLAIAYQIEKQYHIKLNEKEREIIAALIKNSKLDLPMNLDAPNSKIIPLASQNSLKMAQELINVCSMRLHPMIKIDNLLLSELASHLDYAIFRLSHHIPIRNQYIDILKEKYAQIYRVAENSVFMIEKSIGQTIPPAEIGFIAMYLLSALERLRTEEDSRLTVVIANDGVGSKSSLLKSRLEFEFPNLHITQILNTFEEIPKNAIFGEIIISTLPIENVDLPVIHVSPFLEVEDIKNIQRWIAEKSHARSHSKLNDLNQQNSLADLIKLPHIVFKDKVDNWQEIVKCASQPLIMSGGIQPRYIEAMIELIDNYGFYMYMGSGVLLLHAKPTDGVNELCISLLKLEESFHFEDMRIPNIDLIFVLGATDDSSHLTSLFQLNELIQFPMFMEKIRQSTHPADIIQTLWQWLPKIPETA